MHKALRSVGKVLALAMMLASLGLAVSHLLGGPVSIVTVQGSSMRPAYSAGDLVLVRRAGSYRPADVVAYRSRQLGTVVLHRIVSRQADTLVLKGDSNGWLDPERPSVEAVVGKNWIRVPLIGGALNWLRTPQGLAAAAGLLATGCAVRLARRRGRNGRRGGAGKSTSLGSMLASPRASSVAIAGCAGLGLVSLALGAAGFLTPKKRPDGISFKHAGEFSYTANVRKGTVYQKSEIVTGDPVYLNLVPSLAMGFTYRFESGAAHEVSGRASLRVEIADESGWKHTMRLRPDTAFSGDESTLRATLDTKRVWRAIDDFERSTGMRNASYALSVLPEVHTQGTVDGKALDAAFAPQLAFRIDRLQLRLTPAISGPSADSKTQDPLHPIEFGSLVSSARTGATLHFGGVAVNAVALRRAALAGTVLSILGLAVLLSGRRPKKRNDETAGILRRYRQWIIPIHRAPERASTGVVDVTSIESLLRLADRYGRMVLHVSEDDRHSFFVEDEGVLYRYRPARPGEAETEDATSEDHSTVHASTAFAFGGRSHA